MELLSRAQVSEVFERFKAQNPNPKPELNYNSPYTLLVAVMLSAQTTDKRVNQVTKDLFALADKPEKMSLQSQEKIAEIIRPVGLTKAKSKNVLELSKKLCSDFEGKVPDSREKLMTLPGVGRKTANVVLNVVFNQPTMPVDTHLLRICPKIGLAEGNTPETVEASLLQRIPEKYMLHAHHWLILHGRYVCKAKKPDCENCIIKDLCIFWRNYGRG
ncbi:MAG: endonuclease III [Treponema sp.]|nr:endonuclease III [Treponema sp.]